MKTTTGSARTYIALICLIVAACSRPEENIAFYEVALECGAAEELGCGSRAKPVLLEMEQHEAISEAWLNRSGTVYAIVHDGTLLPDAAGAIFEKHGVEFFSISGEEAESYLSGFRKSGQWFRGAAVDELSLEEARILGQQAVDLALNGGFINQDEADQIESDVTTYFSTELVKIRTYEELREDSETTFLQAVVDIYEKNIGHERTTGIIEAMRQRYEGE